MKTSTLLYYTIFLLAAVMASCTPQGRLARLVKRHPELVRSDTMWVSVPTPADTIVLTDTVPLRPDPAEVRLITDSLFKLIDFSTLKIPGTKETIYKYLTTAIPGAVVLPTDTFTVEDEGMEMAVWFEGRVLRARAVKKPGSIDVPVEVNTVEPVETGGPEWWWWLLACAVVGLMWTRTRRSN